MGKEIIETLNYEEKMENNGFNYKFSKDRLASQPCLASNSFIPSVLYPLTLQVTVDLSRPLP